MTAPALSGAQRAAVLAVALGVETSSKLIPGLSDAEAERVTVEIARLQSIPSETVEAVLKEFYLDASRLGTASLAKGGLAAARELITSGFEEPRATPLLHRVEAATEGTGFDLARRAEAARLAAFIAGEHPQTAALVLSRLEARPAADVLTRLPAESRADVIRRLSSLGTPSPEALRSLDEALRQSLGPQPEASGGAKKAADILTQASREASKSVLEALQAQDPTLASEIETLIFTFDDLVGLSDRALGRVLSGVDQSVLALALRGTEVAFQERAFGAISERVGAAVREEMELAAPARVSDVEDAQRTIAEAALALAESGEIEVGATESAATTI